MPLSLCAGRFLGMLWCLQVQSLECCDLSLSLYSFTVYSINSSMQIDEVLSINQLLLKLNQFMCNQQCLRACVREILEHISWHYPCPMYGFIKFGMTVKCHTLHYLLYPHTSMSTLQTSLTSRALWLPRVRCQRGHRGI